MSIDLIPSNDLKSYAPVFGRDELLDSSVTVDASDRAAATRYLDKHAPDLMGMILGLAA
jgi:hypothetical protein